jgi:hypothetical protein
MGELMRLTIIVVGWTLMVCIGCQQQNETPDPILPSDTLVIYQHTVYGRDAHDRVDTVALPQKHNATFLLLDTTSFTLFGTEHVVRGYSNEFESAMDGYFYMLELDSFGMIYGHSLSWPGNYSIVHTTSDSLNRLINAALGAAFLPSPQGAHYTYERAKEARAKAIGE